MRGGRPWLVQLVDLIAAVEVHPLHDGEQGTGGGDRRPTGVGVPPTGSPRPGRGRCGRRGGSQGPSPTGGRVEPVRPPVGVSVPEVGVPEVGVPGWRPGGRRPGGRRPEVGAPEVSAPGRRPRGPGAPEVGAPEVGVPEVGAPEVGAPEVGVPEVGAPRSASPRSASRRLASRRLAYRRLAPRRLASRRSAPRRSAPRGRRPGGRRPEVGAPEVGVPEVGAPRSAPAHQPSRMRAGASNTSTTRQRDTRTLSLSSPSTSAGSNSTTRQVIAGMPPGRGAAPRLGEAGRRRRTGARVTVGELAVGEGASAVLPGNGHRYPWDERKSGRTERHAVRVVTLPRLAFLVGHDVLGPAGDAEGVGRRPPAQAVVVQLHADGAVGGRRQVGDLPPVGVAVAGLHPVPTATWSA